MVVGGPFILAPEKAYRARFEVGHSKHYTLGEAAAFLGEPVERVRQWVDNKHLPYVLVDGNVGILDLALRDFRRNRQRKVDKPNQSLTNVSAIENVRREQPRLSTDEPHCTLYYTPKQAAEMLGVHFLELNRLVRHGVLPAVSIDRHRWFPAEPLEEQVKRKFGLGGLARAPRPQLVQKSVNKKSKEVELDKSGDTGGRASKHAPDATRGTSPKSSDFYYMTGEVARLLGKAPHEVWTMAALGKLRVDRVGIQRMFLKQSVEALLRKERTRAGDEAINASVQRKSSSRATSELRHYSYKEAARKLHASVEDVQYKVFIGQLKEEVVDGERVLPRRAVDALLPDAEKPQASQDGGSRKRVDAAEGASSPAGTWSETDTSGGCEGYFYTPAQVRELIGAKTYERSRGTLPRVVVDDRIWHPAQAVDDLARRRYGASKIYGSPKPRMVEVRKKEAKDEGVVAPEVSKNAGSLMSAPLSANALFVEMLGRTGDQLLTVGIHSLTDLCRTEPERLLAIPGFGAGTLRAVNAFLAANNLPPISSRSLQGQTKHDMAEGYDAPSRDLHSPQRKRNANASGRGRTKPQATGPARVSRRARFASHTPVGPSPEPEQTLLSLLCGSDLARETLSAIDGSVTDETLAALSRCLNNRPRDEQDLLALLYASKFARQALLITAEPLTDEALDAIAGCLRKEEQQLDKGILHEGAGMDWAPVQALNQRLRPPARTLPELLQRSQGSSAETVTTVGKLTAALEAPSLDAELDLLLSYLNQRETEVLRKRFSVERRSTLEELGAHLGVTRERVRQISKSISERLRNAYYWELPLLRTRTAMLLIRQRQRFAIDDILSLLRESGLTSSEETVRTLLTVWRAVDPDELGVRETLALWRVVNPTEYVFPEEVLSVASTGLTPRQQALSKQITPAARTLAGRTGAVTTLAVREALGYGMPASDEEVASVLAKVGFREVVPGYWAGRTEDYSAPREVTGKMLSACGPLSLQQLRRGVLRHHKRFGYPVVPVQVLGAVLAHDEAFEVHEDDTVDLKKPGLFRTHKGSAEGTWLRLVGEEGPVVHAHRIVRAFAANKLQNVTAYRLMKESALVEEAGRQLFCLPGAHITEADLSAGRRQEFWSGRSEWARGLDLVQSHSELEAVEDASESPRQDVVDNRMGNEARTFSARTVAEAVDAACSQLGIAEEALVYEIRDPGLGYILGLSDQPATIAVLSGAPDVTQKE